MVQISKSDLFYKDYSWTVISGDDPKITGEPDSTFLNRWEGYEVLYFINKFCEMYSLEQRESARKVERMIREKVPGEVRSQTNIKDWIAQNWNFINF